MISFERINVSDLTQENMNVFGNMNIFHTLPWVAFVEETMKAEPVALAIKSNNQLVGYFFGLIVHKFGIRILGSPFRGWDTYYMGFNLTPGISLCEILGVFPAFVFRTLHCHYIEIIDPLLTQNELNCLPFFKVDRLPWLALDLSPTEDELFANMKGSARTAIRKSIASGIVIETASDPGFADEYYAQYCELLKYKSYTPTYDVERVRQMIQAMLPTGHLLLLRARNSDGVCIATAIFLFLNRTAVYWGGASWHEYRALRPNELLFWHAMQYLKAHGITDLYLGETSEQFKKKFGSYYAPIFRIRKAKNKILDVVLDFASSSKNYRYRNLISKALRK
jgi:hypothetical protein